LLFTADQNVGQEAIGFGPGGNDLIGRAGAQNFTNRGQQILAHDGIMFGLDGEGGVFLRDHFHRVSQDLQIVDVRGIGGNRPRQRPLLRAGRLVRRVEEGGDFRIVGEHPLVEVPGQGFAMLGQDWRGGFHNGDGLRAKHAGILNMYLLYIL
jgi:hypothetical protein